MGKLTLILGGARSGKSSYAEKRAKELGGDDVLYLATSQAKDAEMQERIKNHRSERPSAWVTLEAPRNIAPPFKKLRITTRGRRVPQKSFCWTVSLFWSPII